MSYELFVSLRHLKSKRTQKFISLNTWISVGGVALGVMALIVVIAVMSGFGKDLRDKILGTNSHVVVSNICLLYTSPSPRDKRQSRMPSSA